MKTFHYKTTHTIASFDVDAQNCFTPLCPDELPVPEGTEVVKELNLQAKKARLRIGSKDAHTPHAIWVANPNQPQFSPIEGENVDIRWNIHAVPGTTGFQLIHGLPPITAYDFFVWKGIEPDMHPYGACYHDLAEKMSTGVIEYLKQQQIQTILIGGLATDYCVKNTAQQLNAAGFEVVINLAACRGVNPQSTKQALSEMQQEGIHLVTSAKQIQPMK
ncbi:nicotinamidase [Magnetococcales bacterium HHB-1]